MLISFLRAVQSSKGILHSNKDFSSDWQKYWQIIHGRSNDMLQPLLFQWLSSPCQCPQNAGVNIQELFQRIHHNGNLPSSILSPWVSVLFYECYSHSFQLMKEWEGDRVTILDVRQLIGQPAVAPSQENIPVTDLILTQSCFDIFTLSRHCTPDEA